MVIAITGGIGSGKSLCLHYLSSLGYATIGADEINAQLLCDPTYQKKMIAIFPECLTAVNNIDKKIIRSIISVDDRRRGELNALAHGEIKKIILLKVAPYKNLPLKIFVEMPLLVESGMEKDFDSVWNIIADNNIRLERTAIRDGVTLKDVEALVAKQATDEERARISLVTLYNSGSISSFYAQIDKALAI